MHSNLPRDMGPQQQPRDCVSAASVYVVALSRALYVVALGGAVRPSDTGSVSEPGAAGIKAGPATRAVHEAQTGGGTSKSKEELKRALGAVKEGIKKPRESQGAFPFVWFACQCHAQVP